MSCTYRYRIQHELRYACLMILGRGWVGLRGMGGEGEGHEVRARANFGPRVVSIQPHG